MIQRKQNFLTQRAIEFSNNKTTLDALKDPTFKFPESDKTVLALSRYEKEIEMNLVGAVIWDLLEKPQTIDSITLSLVEIFDVDISILKKDVEAFLLVLKKAELINL